MVYGFERSGSSGYYGCDVRRAVYACRMPTITIRVTEVEKHDIETEAESLGQTTSEYVRRSLNIRAEHEDVIGELLNSVEQLWARVEKIEQKVGSR